MHISLRRNVRCMAMRHDILADALTAIKNAENVGKERCRVARSRLVIAVLKALKEAGYIREFTEEERSVEVSLSGKINELAAIKPRFPAKKDGFVKFESRYLPSRNVGVIFVSTPEGVITHNKAREMGVGGRLIAYVF